MVNYQNQIKEIEKNISRVIKGGCFILGPEVHTLEQKIAKYIGAKYAVGVNSCTDALIYSLKSLGIKSGDEVLCPVLTFVGTAESIILANARPIFVDIDPRTYNINPDCLEKLITKRTKAIIPVHLFGQSANMKKIMRITKKYNLKVVEDNAQSFGAEHVGRKTGNLGHLGCLSFYPSKILGAFGDGGMVLTNNFKLFNTVRMLRNNGLTKYGEIYYNHRIAGGVSRLHEIQAAVLQTKFKYLKENLNHRQRIANIYNILLEGIGDLILPFSDDGNSHIYSSYIIRTSFRDKLKNFLSVNGFETTILYPRPLHFFKAFKFLKYKSGDFPEAEKAAKEVLGLPINEFLSIKEIKNIVNLIKKCFND